MPSCVVFIGIYLLVIVKNINLLIVNICCWINAIFYGLYYDQSKGYCSCYDQCLRLIIIFVFTYEILYNLKIFESMPEEIKVSSLQWEP